ncbi:MAG: twin-arginine translocase TatA/TatE family subunit [Hyphomicrobiales bacterium]|nr:twin-arginine translocase TatA/TatE family subunit [Hyphomicrobiales bacterium]
MAPSWIQILIVVVLLVLLFGRGKISELMGDVAKGIKSFKKGIAEDDTQGGPETVKSIEHEAADAMDTAKTAQGNKAETG